MDSKIALIKNTVFKKNVVDLENNMIVKSVYFKQNNVDKLITRMVWQYYRHRGKLDVNCVIEKYGRNNLIINYSLES
jgi:hypothetical protein